MMFFLAASLVSVAAAAVDGDAAPLVRRALRRDPWLVPPSEIGPPPEAEAEALVLVPKKPLKLPIIPPSQIKENVAPDFFPDYFPIDSDSNDVALPCACSPRSFEVTLDYSNDCGVDTLEANAGILDTACLVFDATGQPLPSPDYLDARPSFVDEVIFVEWDRNDVVINDVRDARGFADGASLNLTSIADSLDPDTNLKDQLDLVPAAAALILAGRDTDGNSAVFYAGWEYDQAYCGSGSSSSGSTADTSADAGNERVIGAGDELASAVFGHVEDALWEFCPRSAVPAPDPTPGPPPATLIPTYNPTELPTLSPSTESPTEPPTDSPSTETPTHSPSTETPTDAPSTETPTHSPSTETPTHSPSTETPTSSPSTETPTHSPSTETPTHSPSTETPTNSPSTETPTNSPSTETPTHTPSVSPTLRLVAAGNNGQPPSAFPLGECEGECDSDMECAGDLVCFLREGTEAVPGCGGFGIPGYDYCAVRPANYLGYVAESGVPRSKYPLGPCDGDCDHDEQCGAGLVCFQRSGREPVPGCVGEGLRGKDYCAYELTDVDDNRRPLGLCEGDCDDDSDCDAGLTCYQRRGFRAVPGCAGSGTRGRDYCVREDP